MLAIIRILCSCSRRVVLVGRRGVRKVRDIPSLVKQNAMAGIRTLTAQSPKCEHGVHVAVFR